MTLNGDENRQVIDALNAAVDALIRLKQDRMAAVVSARDSTFELARAMMVGAIVLSLLIGVGVAITMARAITSSVRAVQATLTSDRKSTRLNSSHLGISYAVFCLKKKTRKTP